MQVAVCPPAKGPHHENIRAHGCGTTPFRLLVSPPHFAPLVRL